MTTEVNQYGVIGWLALALTIPVTVFLFWLLARAVNAAHDCILNATTKTKWVATKETEEYIMYADAENGLKRMSADGYKFENKPEYLAERNKELKSRQNLWGE